MATTKQLELRKRLYNLVGRNNNDQNDDNNNDQNDDNYDKRSSVSSNQTSKNEFEQLAFPKFRENFIANFIDLSDLKNAEPVIFFPEFPEYTDSDMLKLAKTCCPYINNAEKITPDIVGYVNNSHVRHQEIENKALKIDDIDKKTISKIMEKYDEFVKAIKINKTNVNQDNTQRRLSQHLLDIHKMENTNHNQIKYIVFEGTSGSRHLIIQEKLRQLERDLAVMMSSGQLRLVQEPICVAAGLILNNKNLINTVIKVWKDSLQKGDYYTLVSYFIVSKKFIVDIESFTDTIFNLETQVKSIDNKVDNLRNDMQQVKSDVKQMQTAIDNLTSKLDQVLSKLSGQ